MDDLITTIRTAVGEGSTTEQRQAGAVACRAILAALEAQPGGALSFAAAPPQQSPLAGLQVDQLLDITIAKLRTMLPDGTEPARSPRLQFPLITPPTVGGRSR